MSSHRECQPQIHSAGVALHRDIQKLSNLGKLDDRVKAAVDFGFAHAEYRAIEVNIFPPRQLGMESGANLEQAAQSPAKSNAALSGIGDLGNNFQQSTLACAIAAKNPDNIALSNFEADIIERPEFSRWLRSFRKCLSPCRRVQIAHNQLAQVLAMNGPP